MANSLCPLCQTVCMTDAVKVSKKLLKTLFLTCLRDTLDALFHQGSKEIAKPVIKDETVFVTPLDPKDPPLELAFEKKSKKIYIYVFKMLTLYTSHAPIMPAGNSADRLARDLSLKRIRDIWIAHREDPAHVLKAQIIDLVIKLFSISSKAMSLVLIPQHAFYMLSDFDAFASATMT